MHNINELIGIIKGINFDGIINSQEVKRLQTWVEQNRNLTYEAKQDEFIALVESAIQNQYIDNDGREMLIKRSSEYAKVAKGKTDSIFELNGIIDGILCDGVVNQDEVSHLREWLDTYAEALRKKQTNTELLNSLCQILQDGTVTEEEQQRLLELISKRIELSFLESKLSGLTKLICMRKNIGPELIEILDNRLAMMQIHKLAEKQLYEALLSYGGICKNPEIVVVSLVLIAMLGYEEGNYYEAVRKTYKDLYLKYSEQKVEGMIRSLLSRYKHESDSASRTRIINVALENALVPQAYLPAFFEFVFDIYKVNFDYDLPEDPINDFAFVYDGLKNNLLSEGNDISVNATQKTYKLIETTKHLISQKDGREALIKLSIIVLKLIDKRYWNKEIKIFNPYLKVGYEVWEKQLTASAAGRQERKSRQSELHSRWEPEFVLRGQDSIFLTTPTHRVKSSYDYRDIVISVYNGSKMLQSDPPSDIREIIGGYEIKPQSLQIEDPLGRLTYRVTAGNEVIYDSGDKLYRECLIFDEKGHEIPNHTDFEGIAFICYQGECSALKGLYKGESYRIGCIPIRLGDTLEVSGNLLSFSAIMKPGVIGEELRNCFIRDPEKGENIPVYRKVQSLVFEIKSDSGTVEILVNGHGKKLSEMQYKSINRGASVKYIVDLDLQESDIYSLEVNLLTMGSKMQILKKKFACDSKLSFNAREMGNGDYNFYVASGLMKEAFSEDISAVYFDLEMVRFICHGTEYAYLLPFNTGFYRINEGDWHDKSEEIWIGDIALESTLILLDSEVNGLYVFSDKGMVLEDNVAIKDRGLYKEISVGFLNSYKANGLYSGLVFTQDGRKRIDIPCYNRCEMIKERTEIRLSESPKEIQVTPVFHGRGNVFFEISNSLGEGVFKSDFVESGHKCSFADFRSFEEYTFSFYEKPKGLLLQKNAPFYQTSQIFYARPDFVGHVFKIEDIYFNQMVRGQFLEKTFHLSKAYVRIMEVIDDETFRGEVFVKTRFGEWVLENINPVCVEPCSEIIEDTLDLYITNEDDGCGLLVDFNKHGILNSLDSMTAPDIFLYTVNVKGEENYGEEVKSY